METAEPHSSATGGLVAKPGRASGTLARSQWHDRRRPGTPDPGRPAVLRTRPRPLPLLPLPGDVRAANDSRTGQPSENPRPDLAPRTRAIEAMLLAGLELLQPGLVHRVVSGFLNVVDEFARESEPVLRRKLEGQGRDLMEGAAHGSTIVEIPMAANRWVQRSLMHTHAALNAAFTAVTSASDHPSASTQKVRYSSIHPDHENGPSKYLSSKGLFVWYSGVYRTRSCQRRGLRDEWKTARTSTWSASTKKMTA